MAEEPRRSGRATKGQHTKNLDLPEPPPPKRKGKGQTKAPKPTSTEPTPAPNEEEEIIRCVCGEYEEEEDVERDMICCDKCSAWQHNDCMGLTFGKGDVPAEYFCEQCSPESHKELLEKMARGEKPWEEVAKKRAQIAEERKARRRKGGKRGKRGRASEVKQETAQQVSASAAAAPSTEVITAPHESNGATAREEAGPSSSQKRKFDEQADVGPHEPGPKQKLQRLSTGDQVATQDRKASPAHERKASTAGVSPSHGHKMGQPAPEVVGNATNPVSTARQNVAKALSKLFVDQATQAQEQGSFNVPPGKTKEEIGERLGHEIEYSMYKNLCAGSGEPNEAYKQQMRTILFNVRKNPSLRDRLLVGNISPDAVSTMSTQDMASKELRQKDAEIKRESERQHIIVQEQGPRIRRTHKGEELVENDNQSVGTESIFSAAPARRDTLAESEGHAPLSPRAASPASPTTMHQPEFKEYHGSVDTDKQQRRPYPIDIHVPPGGTERRPSTTFNIQNVWSSVQSPGSGAHNDKPFPQDSSSYHESLPTNKVQPDAEIDQLLKDEDAETPPYSPKDLEPDGIVWRGKVMMNPVAEFEGMARHVGGADLSGRIPWGQLAPSTLTIDGRIETQLASNYLCGLRFSQTTDVSVIAIATPESPQDRAEFEKMFKYFVERKRYGVIGKHPLPAVKDTYIVPVEAGASKKPEFIELLENNAIEDPTPERILLVVFVVKTSNNNSSTPSAHQTPRESMPITASPLTSTPGVAHQHSQFATASGIGVTVATPSNFSNAPSGSSKSENGSQQQPSSQPHCYPPQVQSYNSPQSPPQSLTGKAAASQLLGAYAASPAVEQLLEQAPHADIEQLKVVAGILAQTPAAANDYQLLMKEIVQTTNGT